MIAYSDMRCKRISSNDQVKAFSLLEMAIVLVIVGLVIGMSLSAGKMQLDVAELQGTKGTIGTVKQALAVYREKAGRYPCPAVGTETDSDSGYGWEANSGECFFSCPAGLICSGEAVIGVLPFKELGIPESLSEDKYGSKLTYVVDRMHTVRSEYNSGNLSVRDANGNELLQSPTLGRAIYLLLSHGKDKAGAWPAGGGTRVSCSSGTIDTENCDDDDVFVSTRMNNGDVSSKYFDDVIGWETQRNVYIASSVRAPTSSSGSSSSSSSSAGDSMLVAGGFHSCAIDTNGKAYCWGDNTDAQLGDGTTTDRLSPTLVLGGYTDWTYIFGHQFRTCGIRSDNTLYCWGDNWAGQLGDGTTTQRTSPVLVNGGFTDWNSVVVTSDHTCGIRNGGIAYCWGYNVDGRLGDGTTTNRHSPTLVNGGYADWTDITVGADHTCGIRNGGVAYCWGGNSRGQLGDGTTTNRSLPTVVAGGYTDWEDIDAGENHTCAIRGGGLVYCWGENDYGQLGDGTNVQRNSPVLVSGGFSDWSGIEAGGYHSCSIRDGGKIYCWGGNWFGEIGDGTMTERTTPTLVSGGYTDWEDVSAAGYAFTCGMRSNKTAYCWGYNNKGQLGDGTTTNRTVPTVAASGLNF